MLILICPAPVTSGSFRCSTFLNEDVYMQSFPLSALAVKYRSTLRSCPKETHHGFGPASSFVILIMLLSGTGVAVGVFAGVGVRVIVGVDVLVAVLV